MKNIKTKNILKKIDKIFLINKKVKDLAYNTYYDTYYNEYHTDKHYGLASAMYFKKEKYLVEVIDEIKKEKLPVKYGWSYDDFGNKVLYFSYLKNQASFHIADWSKFKNLKTYKGDWIGRIQTRAPFVRFYK